MRERLEDVIRPGEVAEDLVLLLPGGVHAEGINRLRDQASEMNRRFSFEGGDCYGISAFAATEESESWILARNMAVRRRYYLVRYEGLSRRPVRARTSLLRCRDAQPHNKDRSGQIWPLLCSSYVPDFRPGSENPALTWRNVVGDTGFEPVTSSVSRKRATAAPIALVEL